MTTSGVPRPCSESEVLETIQLEVSDILGVPPHEVAPEDNFFSLGGSSLDAVELMARLEHLLGSQLPIDMVIDRPELRSLARMIAASTAAEG